MRVVYPGPVRLLLITALSIVFLSSAITAWAAVDVEILESTSSQLKFRVSFDEARLESLPNGDRDYQRIHLPGTVPGGETGLPTLPSWGKWIALPPAGEARVTSRVIKRTPLGRGRLAPVPTPRVGRSAEFGQPRVSEELIEADGYASFARGENALVRLGEAVYMRRHYAAPITIDPVLYDVGSGAVTLAEVIEVTVSFSSSGASDLARPKRAGREGLSLGVLNPEVAGNWKTLSPRQSQRLRAWETPRDDAEKRVGGVAPLDDAAFQSSEFRIQVAETRLYRITGANLFSAGFPSDIPRRFIRLYQRRAGDPLDASYPAAVAADVPLHFLGSPDPNGTLAAGDVLVFHGVSAEDDAAARQIDGDTFRAISIKRPDNFNNANIYWMVAADPGTDAWARMATETLGASQGSPQPFYARDELFSGDSGYQDNPRSVSEPRYHWNRFDENVESNPEAQVVRSIELVHPRAGTDVTVAWSVVTRIRTNPTIVRFNLEKDGTRQQLTEVNIASFDRAFERALTTATVPADNFGHGPINFEMARLNGAGGVSGAPASFLASVRLAYEGLYQASSDRAFFHTNQSGGDVDIEVTGFSEAGVLLFDVTDLRAPRVISLSPVNVVADGAEFTLSLRVPQAAGEQREFVGLIDRRIRQLFTRDVEEDPVFDVVASTPVSQVLAIGPESYRAGTEPWLDWRRQNDLFGWDYNYVNVQDIYDQFSGGLKSPEAIKEFLEYAYTAWGAEAALLVGDANENARQVPVDETPEDFVPPSLHIQTFDTNELLASDKWYGIFGADQNYPFTLNQGPDMLVGRLPANTNGQLDAMVSKILTYEQPSVDDEWRERTLWMADDAWSTSYFSTATNCYRYDSLEDRFAASQDSSSRWVTRALNGQVSGELWDLDTFTEGFRETAMTTCEGRPAAERSLVSQSVNTVVTPSLVNLLSQGWLVVAYQGHANYNVLGHEGFVQLNTLANLRNEGRPFLFFGMGCHVSDFLQEDELTSATRSIGEVLVTQTSTGAIATYGSSGFEFLQANAGYMELITRQLFLEGRVTGLVGDGNLPSQLLLAEVMGQAETDVLATSLNDRRQMMAQYNMLGDPLLRLTAGPPTVDLRADGQPLADGAELRPAPGSTDLALSFDSAAFAGVDRVEVSDSVGRDYPVDLPVGSDPRQRTGSLALTVYPQSYTVSVDAYDGSYPSVRPRSYAFTVPFELSVTIDGEPVAEGSGGFPAGSSAEVTMEFTAAVAVPQATIAASIDGGDVTGLQTTALSGDDTSWRVQFTATGRDGSVPQVLRLSLSGVETSFALSQVAAVDLSLQQHFPFPNPSNGPVRFIGRATRVVDRVSLTVYDLRGRVVHQLQESLTAATTDFVFTWDGLDQEGDELANGVYMYRLEASDGSATARGEMGRLVFMR